MNMKEKLESLGKNSIRLKIARKETYKLGATRFGGKPDVPPDFVWPNRQKRNIQAGRHSLRREAGCAARLRLAHL